MQPLFKRAKVGLSIAITFALTFLTVDLAQASRNGIERPLNSFAVGITFKANGISDLCSGALISPTFIATAAHCVAEVNGSLHTDYIFTAPGTKLDAPINPATQVKVLKITVPDGYFKSETSEANDIAFIQLDRPLATKGFIRIATETEVSSLVEGTLLKGYGHGAVFETGETYSVVPREYGLNWSKPTVESKLTFQLSSKDSVACSGDSGGPITTVLSSGEEVLIATLHSAAFVINRCGTTAPDGLFYMQVSLISSFMPLISSELQKSFVLPTPTPKPTIKPKTYKITCVKGKIKKYVTGTNPKCPTGYKQTAKVLVTK